jgi:hypothetical protein
MKPPSFVEVDHLMTDWVTQANELRRPNDQPLAERLATVHHSFECVHPFLDGNGRAGRLLLNLLLVRLGHPPAVIYKRQRTAYLKALRRADAGDIGPLGELLARAVTDSLYRFVVPAVAGPNRLVPLASLAGVAPGMTVAALRVAAARGRLKAQKSPAGVWLSSRKWVLDYAGNRYRRSGDPSWR